MQARPVAVHAVVFNDAAVRMLAAGASPADVAEAAAAHDPEDPDGPWSVAVGGPEGGHVALSVPSASVFADPSIDQASRPVKRMQVPIICTLVSYELPCSWRVTSTSPDGRVVAVQYRKIDTKWYTSSPNWRRAGKYGPSPLFKAIAGECIKRVRDPSAG